MTFSLSRGLRDWAIVEHSDGFLTIVLKLPGKFVPGNAIFKDAFASRL